MADSPTDNPTSPAPYDADELGQYRRVSVLSVASLIVALLSLFALAWPLLLILPAIALVLALFALGRIHASDGTLTGVTLARVALLLAVLTIVATITRLEMRKRLYFAQAETAARYWLQLVADNQWDEALDLISGVGKRSLSPPTEDPRAPAPPFSAEYAKQKMEADPFFTTVRASSAEDLSLIESQLLIEAIQVRVAQSYRLPPKAEDPQPNTAALILVRYLNEEGEVVWLVDDWGFQDSA